MKQLNLQQFEITGRDGKLHRFTGRLLGAATSRVNDHNHATTFAPRGDKCSACRWFEVAVYRFRASNDVHDGYVVHTVGGSVVPGEQRLSRVEYTDSAFEVIELLTIRPSNRKPFMMSQSARALAQASDHDDDLRDAYINRAVV